MTNDLNTLSERERAVLRLVATGATNQQIADLLDISANTVKVHLRNVFGKIGAASRTEATLYAVRTGLVSVGNESNASVDVAELPSAAYSLPVPVINPTPEQALPDVTVVVPPTVPQPPTELAVTTQPALTPSSAPRVSRTFSHREVGVLGVLIGVLLAATIIALIQVVRSSAQGGSTHATVGTPQATASGSSSWVPRTPPGQPLIGAAVAINSGPIFVIGGSDGTRVLPNVASYDPLSDTWTSRESKPTPVRDAQAASVVLSGKLFVPGGRTADGSIVDVLEIYDPKSHSWSKGHALPAPRSGYGLVVVGGQLYLFGGWDGAAYRAEVYRYAPESDHWDELTPMPTARAFACVVSFEEGVYVIGGENRSGPLYNNEEYTPASEGAANAQPWRQRTPLPQPVSKSGCGAVDNKIYLFGGSNNSGTQKSYDVRTDMWSTESAAPEPIGDQAAVAYRDGFFFIIGGGSDASPSNRLYAFSARYNIALPVKK